MVGFACMSSDRLFDIGRLRVDLGSRYDSSSLLSRRRARSLKHRQAAPSIEWAGPTLRIFLQHHISASPRRDTAHMAATLREERLAAVARHEHEV